jgi:KipI family sensor histidine kinase inhibitor
MDIALKAYGETGILAHHLSEPERQGLGRALIAHQPQGCLEYVWGDDSVCFIFEQPTSTDELSKWLEKINMAVGAPLCGELHEVPVVYDGPDLESVAAQIGLSIDEVIGIHSAPTYTVRMLGFAPGFPYLAGLDQRLHLPRKGSPRKRIEPGAVAIGGSHAGIYSVASPGGWHLLGRTEWVLFDPAAARGSGPDAKKVFLFSPGDQLRFQPVR